MKQKFKLVAYSPKWKTAYLAEKKELIKIFKPLLQSIHHIGSTAIPSSKAKPEIDILVVLKDTSSLSKFDNPIKDLGYRVRGECLENGGTPGRFYYSKDIDNIRTHKLHVCKLGHHEIMEKLLFVKYLNEDQESANRYSELKVRLSQKYNYGNHIEKYLEGKGDFIKSIIKKAQLKYKGISYQDFC